MDVSNAQVEISGVTEDKTAREEKSDRDDGLHEHISAHVDVFSPIEKRGRPLENSSAHSRKRQVPGDQKDWVLELPSVIEVVVVDDDRRAQHDPNGDDHGSRELGLGGLWRRCGRRRWQRRGSILVSIEDCFPAFKRVLCSLFLFVPEIPHRK